MIKKVFKEWVLPMVTAVVAALLIRNFLFFPSPIPSGSMNPTIVPNEVIFVTRIYHPENLKRGDIVVFNSKELKERLVKRLIGISGDRVAVKDGYVYLNGVKKDEPYVSTRDGKTFFNGETIVVPQGKYLFMGDNRSISFDSRYWKNTFIDRKDIIGKARAVIFPFNRIRNLK